MAYADKYLDYYAVVEQMSPENSDTKIIECKENSNGLNYLRFTTCLQGFGKRNRNRRLWLSKTMKTMLGEDTVTELLNNGGIPGENGHPVPSSGNVTMERILTIDPNNMSHLIKKFEWKTNDLLYGEIETLDEGPGSPGYKFMRNILQNLNPSFSLRSVVPQKKNMDGSIDVTGPGRFVTFDRVILPSHAEAYIDKSIPVKNIITQSKFETVMESMVSYTTQHSDKFNHIVDNAEPVMESAQITKDGFLSVDTKKEGRLFIAPEMKFRKEISDIMRNL